MHEPDEATVLRQDRALRPGYQLHWYRIDRILGRGGFGITYLAHDHNLDRPVAIKEYLPTMFADRGTACSVVPLSPAHEESYRWGLDSFLNEARTLARFDHTNIVRVHSVFERNQTAYMVMEYEDGDSLQAVYEQPQAITEAFLSNSFFPIFDGLEQIHKLDFIHRDIKPPNIYLRRNQVPVLLDFGSAREASVQKDSDLTVVVTRFYAPLEQYSSGHGTQGDWTDIYALAASMYEGITGSRPADSQDRYVSLSRTGSDTLVPLDVSTHPDFSPSFLNAVMSGLALEKDDRPQSIADWRSQFESVKPSRRSSDIPRECDSVAEPNARPRRWLPAAGIAAVAIVLGGYGAFRLLGSPSTTACADAVDQVCLAALPVPSATVDFMAADQQLAIQLDDLGKLAAFYQQLASVSSIKPEIDQWVEDILGELEGIASTWHPGRFPEVATRLRQIADTLPASDEQRASINALLDTQNPQINVTREAALGMIEANRIVSPAGDSLIDHINSMNVSDYQQLIQSDAWQSLMKQLSNGAVARIKASQFDAAAQLVEMALLMDPDQDDMQQLRTHLTSQEVIPVNP